jgi:hypothetical protein
MPGCAVALDAFQLVLIVNAVIEFDDLFFDRVSWIQHVEMTIHTALRGEFIVSQIDRRDKLVSGVSQYIPTVRLQFYSL